ncbi:3'-5' exonuclease [Aquifex aeolicus]|uniref:Exonuclease domain-containing protein n=1 Tax=Aquifex aeolicus (strain VF5) TaxID=224324 RepID=O67875_AQUAE|nr:3'-5' exonuclease [Aquifex aeolicus]AAC07843.1 putative protein [Aquifex aeolicus VF5]
MNFLKKFLLLRKAQKSPYFEEFYEEIDLNQKVKDARFVVFDCEATELDVKKAKLLSIGAVEVKNLEIDLSKSFYEILKSDEIKAAEIHGITREDVEKYGKEPKEVIYDFLKYIKGSVLVGYYVKFDVSLVEKYSIKYFQYPIINYKLDLFSFVKREYQSGRSLDDLMKELGVEIRARHNALEDAYITALLFLKYVYPNREYRLKDLPIFL